MLTDQEPCCGRRTQSSGATRRLLWALAPATMVLLAGCGGDRGPERAVVSGAVTLNGKPLADGMIRFVPAADAQVPASGAPIVDGAYCVKGHGGVPVGTFKVAIEGYRPIANPKAVPFSMPPHSKDGPMKSQFLPPKYNAQTQLEATIAPGSGAVTKNFDLTD
jgi:hypothetical protein